MEQLIVEAPDGVTLQARIAGPGDGPGIVFIHGFSQSQDAWTRQMQSGLADTFRMVSYDSRGHGLSDKPLEPERYRDPALWAGELQAVMDTAALRRPVLVAWSYAGRIALDYLAAHGDGAIAGVVFVCATSSADAAFAGPAIPFLRQMGSDDEAAAEEGVRGLLRACTHAQLPEPEFEAMVAYNRMTPAAVRRALAGRPADYEPTLKALKVPVLALHGEHDPVNLPQMGRYTASLAPRGRYLGYAESGHMPFWEEPSRFNADLRAFVEEAQAVRA